MVIFNDIFRAIPGDEGFSPKAPWMRLGVAGAIPQFRTGFMDDTGTLWFRSPLMGLWNTARKTWPTVPGPL